MTHTIEGPVKDMSEGPFKDMPTIEHGILKGNGDSAVDVFSYISDRFLVIRSSRVNRLSYRQRMEREMVNHGLETAENFLGLLSVSELSRRKRNDLLVEVNRAVSHAVAFDKKLGWLTSAETIKCRKRDLAIHLEYVLEWKSYPIVASEWESHHERADIVIDLSGVELPVTVDWRTTEKESGNPSEKFKRIATQLIAGDDPGPLMLHSDGYSRRGGWRTGEFI